MNTCGPARHVSRLTGGAPQTLSSRARARGRHPLYGSKTVTRVVATTDCRKTPIQCGRKPTWRGGRGNAPAQDVGGPAAAIRVRAGPAYALVHRLHRTHTRIRPRAVARAPRLPRHRVPCRCTPRRRTALLNPAHAAYAAEYALPHSAPAYASAQPPHAAAHTPSHSARASYSTPAHSRALHLKPRHAVPALPPLVLARQRAIPRSPIPTTSYILALPRSCPSPSPPPSRSAPRGYWNQRDDYLTPPGFLVYDPPQLPRNDELVTSPPRELPGRSRSVGPLNRDSRGLS